MPKMRVLIAASGARRAATAKALGVLRALPDVEVGAAHDAEHFFSSLARGRWHAVILDTHLGRTSADELLAAASHLLQRVAVLVLDTDPDIAARCRDRHSASLLHLDALDQAAPAVEAAVARSQAAASTLTIKDGEPAGIPEFDSAHDLIDHDGRIPQRGLLSCIFADAPMTAEAAAALSSAVGDGGIVSRVRDSGFCVIRRASSPGEALVWAEGLRVRLAADGRGPSVGVAWFEAGILKGAGINQADHALQLARSTGHGRGGVCSWNEVAALRTAESIAASADSAQTAEVRRGEFLSRLTRLLGPVQHEHLTSHSEEVASMAFSLAQLMRFAPAEADTVRSAALLHDLGKAVIPDDLLAKPGALSPTQRLVLNRHSEIGARFADALGLEPAMGRIIRHHHTRFDSPDAAPDAARIVAVADAMVTMTSTRPYSTARTFADALTELRRCRGSMFDPKVVIAAHILGASTMAAAA